MAIRSMWKGALKLSLVQVPCRLYNAQEKGSKVDFNQLHACTLGDGTKTYTKINHKKWCPTCAKELQQAELSRGHEFTKGSYVIVTDEEMDAVAAEKSGVMEISTVTDEPINPIYIDGTLYLVPEEPVLQAFETIRVALGERTAIATVVLSNKSVRVALQAQDEGFIVYKLRAADQIRDFSQLVSKTTVVPQKAEVALATKLLDNLEGSFSYESVKDEYNEAVKALIAAKVNGTEVVAAKPAAPVVSTFAESLAASLKAIQPKHLPTPKGTATPAKAKVKGVPAAKKKSA